ncbi:MAG: trypsin-like serine protease, partial [Burkholderiales bacterium]|nr:trypsin-like serine protease [Burkholderiales bacterium]
MPTLRCIACALAATLQALPAQAILIRADRDDEEYVELATRYPAAVSLGPAGGVGVLVWPRWILTAAHRANALRAGAKLAIAGASVEIQEIFVHPDWKGGAGPDIALVYLRTAVLGVDAVPPYRLQDEVGQTARVVGTGGAGRIGAPAAKADGRARAAINTVDRATEGTLVMRLKGPEDASDLQGALAAGDTGA